MPKGGDIRPTTDRSKESLFSILSTQYILDACEVLDLFAGSGNISFEFASRGAQRIVSIEKNRRVQKQAKQFALDKSIQDITFLPFDAFKYLKSCSEQFDIIFADPPYHLNTIQEIPQLVLEKHLLKPGGMLIIEHHTTLAMHHPNLVDTRTYGQSVFSFFKEVTEAT